MLVWEIFSKENVVKMLVAGIPTFIIATIVPFVSIRFALRQFYSQKWWERKSEAYALLIKQLSEFSFASSLLFEHHADVTNLSKDSIENYNEIAHKSINEIRKQKSAGAFVTSKYAINSINNFLREFDKNSSDKDWIGSFNKDAACANRCIEEIRKIAKKDLKVR